MVAAEDRAHRQTAIAQREILLKNIDRGTRKLLKNFLLLIAACGGQKTTLLGSEGAYYRPKLMITRGNVTVLRRFTQGYGIRTKELEAL